MRYGHCLYKGCCFFLKNINVARFFLIIFFFLCCIYLNTLRRSFHPDSFANAAGHVRAVPPSRLHRHVRQQEMEKGKKEEKKKRKEKGRKNLHLFHLGTFPSFFHLLQLPAAITTPALHGKVAERVRGACGMDTVYRFAPHPSQSSKGMEKRWKKIFNSIHRYNSCTHGRGTVDTCLSANTPLHRSTHCGSARTYRLEKEALTS